MFEADLSELPTADLLESAAEHRVIANRADARLLEHAQVYADRFHPSVCDVRPTRRACDGRERAVVLGGDGCPPIAEFAIAEFAVILGISPMVGARFLGEALALRHRFPFTWARVQSGDATPWKARHIAAACLKLSADAARYVDQRVAPLIDSITPYRLDKIVRAAKMHADPETARAEATEAARARGVFVGRGDDHGNKTIYIKAPAGAVIRHDATITAIADALKTIGDTRPTQHRRADAIGILADPRYTEELLTQARTNPHQTPTPREASTPAETSTSAEASPPTEASAPAGTTAPAGASSARAVCMRGTGFSADDELLAQWNTGCPEPGANDDADRDAPHPSFSDLPDPLDHPFSQLVEPFDPDTQTGPDAGTDGRPMDPAARRALDARLAQIRHDAHARPRHRGTASSTPGASSASSAPGASSAPSRPGHTELFVHLTDHTLATGTGVVRAETIGPLLAEQLTELIGHGPYTVKPVIDLNQTISADAYEIPTKIREHIKLLHPVELFPYGTRESRNTVDLDHIQPYDPLGPPHQTNTTNLAPLSRYAHRVKTHARGWNVRRLDHQTLEWTTPHNFKFHVNPTGTHRVDPGIDKTERGLRVRREDEC